MKSLRVSSSAILDTLPLSHLGPSDQSTSTTLRTSFKFQISQIPRTRAPFRCLPAGKETRLVSQGWCDKRLSKPHKIDLKSRTRTQSRNRSQI